VRKRLTMAQLVKMQERMTLYRIARDAWNSRCLVARELLWRLQADGYFG